MICGVTTFVVLLILGMPYAAPLALLVAVLDLIPLVGATLGGALLVVVGLFVEPWKAVVLLVYIVVYQQVEGSVLQPLVYSKAVQLNGLVILIALLVGGSYSASRGVAGHPVAEIIRIVVTELLAYRRTRQEADEPALPPQPTGSGPGTVRGWGGHLERKIRTPGLGANFVKSPRGKFPLGDESLIAPGVHCQLRDMEGDWRCEQRSGSHLRGRLQERRGREGRPPETRATAPQRHFGAACSDQLC